MRGRVVIRGAMQSTDATEQSSAPAEPAGDAPAPGPAPSASESPAGPRPRLRRVHVLLFLVSLAVFAAFAGPRILIHSADNHFVYLADAFLHGQTELTRKPHHQNDWASYEVLPLKGASAAAHGEVVKGFFTRRGGKPNEFRLLNGEEIDIPAADRGTAERKYFVSFPPFPGVAMMPFVALSGFGANDVLFTVLCAALNVLLVFVLLRRLAELGYSQRTEREDLWLTAMLGFGSVHLWCSVLGQVWFTALIVGVACNLAYIYFSLDARHPFLAGLAMAAAFSTRASLLFAAVFFLHQVFFPSHGQRPDLRGIVRKLALFGLPCVVTGLLLLAYNYARFENPTEFGHTYLATGTIARIRDFGLFNMHFLSRNLAAAFTLLPGIDGQAPYLHLSKHGMSLFLTTPPLIWLLWPRRRHVLSRGFALTALTIAVPIFFYQNTGWEQYGFRFSLDFMPYLVGLLALGGRPIDRTFKTMIIIGMLVNAFGAVTFKRGGMDKLYNDYLCEEPK